MKKIFTLDALFVSLFSAAGYGFGYVISDTLGAGALISILCCFIAGAVLGALGEKIVFNRYIQEKTSRRHAVFACVLSAFVLLNIISVRVLRHSLLEDYKSELVFGVVIPVAGFFVSILWYYIRHFRLKAKYGDGSSGFSLDRGSRAYIREQNTRNRELTGGYEKEFAVTLESGV